MHIKRGKGLIDYVSAVWLVGWNIITRHILYAQLFLSPVMMNFMHNTFRNHGCHLLCNQLMPSLDVCQHGRHRHAQQHASHSFQLCRSIVNEVSHSLLAQGSRL